MVPPRRLGAARGQGGAAAGGGASSWARRSGRCTSSDAAGPGGGVVDEPRRRRGAATDTLAGTGVASLRAWLRQMREALYQVLGTLAAVPSGLYERAPPGAAEGWRAALLLRRQRPRFWRGDGPGPA